MERLEEVAGQFRVELLDDAGTRRALDYVERQAPDLVSSVVPQLVTLTQMTGILRQLLSEGLTIRHLDLVLQAVAENGTRLSPRALVGEARVALRQIISREAGRNGLITAISVDPLVDLVLAKAEDSGSLVDVELIERISRRVRDLVTEGAVVVVSKRARPYLRDLLAAKGVAVRVMAHEELAPGYGLSSVGTIEPELDEERAALVQELTS
jgi:type III secretion protein V